MATLRDFPVVRVELSINVVTVYLGSLMVAQHSL